MNQMRLLEYGPNYVVVERPEVMKITGMTYCPECNEVVYSVQPWRWAYFRYLQDCAEKDKREPQWKFWLANIIRWVSRRRACLA